MRKPRRYVAAKADSRQTSPRDAVTTQHYRERHITQRHCEVERPVTLNRPFRPRMPLLAGSQGGATLALGYGDVAPLGPTIFSGVQARRVDLTVAPGSRPG